MRKSLFSLCLVLVTVLVKAQNYDVLTYNLNGTPTNGIKIKTNLPFVNSSQMPTIIMEGYNYQSTGTTPGSIGLVLNYYIYNNVFYNASISSYGNYTPPVYLANEGGKVVIFINSKDYFLRMSIRAFAKGMPEETATNFQNWTTADEALTGTAQLLVPYRNRLTGDIFLPGGIWNKDGNIGIGTTNPQTRLAVAGDISAKKIKVTQTGWPDYVFYPDYQLPSLRDIEKYITAEQHLPGIPAAAQVEKDGLDLGEMNKKLLEKVEELTLYLIQQQKENEAVSLRLKLLEGELEKLKVSKK